MGRHMVAMSETELSLERITTQLASIAKLIEGPRGLLEAQAQAWERAATVMNSVHAQLEGPAAVLHDLDQQAAAIKAAVGTLPPLPDFRIAPHLQRLQNTLTTTEPDKLAARMSTPEFGELLDEIRPEGTAQPVDSATSRPNQHQDMRSNERQINTEEIQEIAKGAAAEVLEKYKAALDEKEAEQNKVESEHKPVDFIKHILHPIVVVMTVLIFYQDGRSALFKTVQEVNSFIDRMVEIIDDKD